MEQFVHSGMDRALIRRSTEGWLPDSIRLNQRTRGIQAADSIHRMRSDWPVIIDSGRFLQVCFAHHAYDSEYRNIV